MKFRVPCVPECGTCCDRFFFVKQRKHSIVSNRQIFGGPNNPSIYIV